jgi:hypothetical protein
MVPTLCIPPTLLAPFASLIDTYLDAALAGRADNAMSRQNVTARPVSPRNALTGAFQSATLNPAKKDNMSLSLLGE